ncbi:MAG TPA: MFS transporter [Gemmatimonadaceae bacterium]|nr:MFS transporter [Gemmatimonadaceae bacterium]
MASAAAPALPSQPEKLPHPLKSRNFALWWTGATLSLVGDQFYIVALPWLVLQMTGSGLAMGLVSMCAGVPRAVLMLMGGAVADRMSPRRLMMITATARAILVGAIGCLAWGGHLSMASLYVLAIGFGIADAFAMPAAPTMMRSLVEPPQLPAANSVWQSTALLASVAAPSPAGIILKSLGAAWAFLIDAFSFVFLIGALWTIPDTYPSKPGVPKPSVIKSIKEGLSYVVTDRPLRALLLVTAVLNLFLAGPLSIGLAYVAKQRFSSPVSFGVWISSVAAGTFVGMLLAGVIRMKRRGLALLGATSILGLLTSTVGFVPGLIHVAVLLAAMGTLSGFTNVQIQAWFQQRVDRTVLGRVASVMMLSAFGLMPLSMAGAGAAVSWSAPGTFLIAGAAVFAISVFGAMQKDVRAIE